MKAYEPTRSINRAEFTKLVLLASGIKNPAACTVNPFPDVPKIAWFAPYICEAKKRGIISGFPDGMFKPALEINFANGAKILAKTFAVPVDANDANYFDQPSIWYRPYTLALLNKKAVAPTIATFDQLLNRGEMAEMLYRLATGNHSFETPDSSEERGLGMGYLSYILEDALGFSVDPPDASYVFAPSAATIRSVFTRSISVKGFAFSHVLQLERCSLSGLWEHCKPTYTDWKIALYVSPVNVTFSSDAQGMATQKYFGGKPGTCVVWGVEGENTEYCLVPWGKKTIVVVRDFIDTNVMQVEGASSLEFSDAMFARIRSSMQFLP